MRRERSAIMPHLKVMIKRLTLILKAVGVTGDC